MHACVQRCLLQASLPLPFFSCGPCQKVTVPRCCLDGKGEKPQQTWPRVGSGGKIQEQAVLPGPWNMAWLCMQAHTQAHANIFHRHAPRHPLQHARKYCNIQSLGHGHPCCLQQNSNIDHTGNCRSKRTRDC